MGRVLGAVRGCLSFQRRWISPPIKKIKGSRDPECSGASSVSLYEDGRVLFGSS